MYGIGIRIGFYLQYFVFIWAAKLFRDNLAERSAAALALWLFKFGATVALMFKIIHHKITAPVEIYIVFLLLLRIPVLRIPALIFDMILDVPLPILERDDVSDSPASFALLIINVGLSMWFWTKGINTVRSNECPHWAFLFERVDLQARWFIYLNLASLLPFFTLALWQGLRRIRGRNREDLNKRKKKSVVHRSTVTGLMLTSLLR
jgi:hypothetical protein